MRHILPFLLTITVLFFITACSTNQPKTQTENTKSAVNNKEVKTHDLQILTVSNANGLINGSTIEKAFVKHGFAVGMNKDMNEVFKRRYGSSELLHTTYRLALVHNSKYTARLIKDYPTVGLIMPLSISIWSTDKSDDISVSSLSLQGMSHITKIPVDNPSLIAYAAAVDKALKDALPGGKYKDNMKSMTTTQASLITTIDADTSLNRFEDILQTELAPLGFVYSSEINATQMLKKQHNNAYSYYKTYSIYKLDAIHTATQKHPEVGALIPTTLYIYKKRDEEQSHISYTSTDYVLSAVTIEDNTSVVPLQEAQELLTNTLLEFVQQ